MGYARCWLFHDIRRLTEDIERCSICGRLYTQLINPTKQREALRKWRESQ